MAINRYLWMIAVLVAIGWAAVVLVHPWRGGPLLDALTGGIVLGTMFGHTALAAIWCAFGPLPLARRLPLSALWLAAVSMAFGLNMAREPNPGGLIVLAMFGGMLLLQWVLVQIPLWLLTARRGLRIVHESNSVAESHLSEQQFGIRHVLILTTLVALVLGFGRFVLGGLKQDDRASPPQSEVLVAYMSLAICNSIYALIVVGMPFLKRGRYAGILLAIIAVGLLSLLEARLLDMAIGQSPNWRDYLMFTSFNLVQATWIAVVLLLRAGGYRLVHS